MSTPENPTPPQAPSITTKQKVAAYVIDAFALLGTYALSTWLSVVLLEWEAGRHAAANGGDASMSGVLLIFLPLVWTALALLYHLLLPSVWRGQTLGSKLAGIKTEDKRRWSNNILIPLLVAALTVVAFTAGCILLLMITI